MKNALLALAFVCVSAAPAFAQATVPPPAVPLTFCLLQAPPTANTWQLSFDGGANEAVTLTPYTTTDTGCPAGTTHTLTLPPTRFTVGTHTMKFFGSNEFGQQTGSPTFTLRVGVVPGNTSVLGIR